MSARIELVRWTDADELPVALDDLIAEAVTSGYAWAADFHQAWQSRPFTGAGEGLFLACEAGKLLGMAAVSADPFVDDAGVGRLRFIYVRESARHRGLGDRLVTMCLGTARGHWHTLRLHTDNAAAARIYERHGFRAVAGDARATHVVTVT
jgi:ribosomal protein S18 acetylase RimI-like enzyme